ncbi:MAG TPA: hypothetical protein VFI15_02795 [Candidatus Limnocylindrales bacterium]|nr:hypothetical protein [Candidatus Limnocylindrales bacterium]
MDHEGRRRAASATLAPDAERDARCDKVVHAAAGGDSITLMAWKAPF